MLRNKNVENLNFVEEKMRQIIYSTQEDCSVAESE